MGLVLEFDELELGAQVSVQTTDRGVISGHAVANGGSSSSGFQLVVVTDDVDHVFNGDGSGGGIQIFPMTIIQCQTIEAARVWKLSNVGVADGWVVAMNIEGADSGEVSVTDNGDVSLQIINVTNPTGQTNNVPYPVFYYDEGEAQWFTLRSRILVS
jgi:hypothetical protein